MTQHDIPALSAEKQIQRRKDRIVILVSLLVIALDLAVVLFIIQFLIP